MSLLDDIEKELGEISPWPWSRGIGNECKLVSTAHGDVLATLSSSKNSTFIAAAPERIKLLVEFARASLALLWERGDLENLDLNEVHYQTEAERKFIAARKALKLEG